MRKKEDKKRISNLVIPRLSLYYRALLASGDNIFISSDRLSSLTNFSAAQIRKDLGLFGQFGIPSKGYLVERLKKSILKILGIDRNWQIALVGVGNLGSALLSYQGFRKQGFNISVAFDCSPKKIGKFIGNVKIQDVKKMPQIIRKKHIRMAIVAVPQEEAEKIIKKLINLGVRAILNFAPKRVMGSKNVEILNIDLSIELEKLAYFLSQKQKL